jgi:hypothetical protein
MILGIRLHSLLSRAYLTTKKYTVIEVVKSQIISQSGQRMINELILITEFASARASSESRVTKLF